MAMPEEAAADTDRLNLAKALITSEKQAGGVLNDV